MLMINYFFSFILGFLVKTVDCASEHGLMLNKFLKIVLPLSYGALMAYLLGNVFLPEFFLGILLGIIVSGKIDSKMHALGFFAFLLFWVFFSQPFNEWGIIFLSAIICFAEEWVNDELVDKKKVRGFLKKFLGIRPFLEITALILSIAYSNFSIFFILLLFDLGYLSSKKIFFYIKNK